MDEAKKAEIVAQLKVANPGKDLFSVESEIGGVFVVHRTATASERRIYRNLRNEDKPLDAQEALMSCVLYPQAAEFAKLREDKPFVVEPIVDGILAASGVYVDAVRKKL